MTIKHGTSPEKKYLPQCYLVSSCDCELKYFASWKSKVSPVTFPILSFVSFVPMCIIQDQTYAYYYTGFKWKQWVPLGDACSLEDRNGRLSTGTLPFLQVSGVGQLLSQELSALQAQEREVNFLDVSLVPLFCLCVLPKQRLWSSLTPLTLHQ